MKTRQESFRVKSYHCTVDGNMRIASLMRYLQETALAHAYELGFGYEQLDEIDSYWVLSNMRIEFARLPRWNDEVTIRTWPSGHGRVIATREFVGSDPRGGELFRAGSEWMVLKRTTNRLRNLCKLGLPLAGSEEKVLAGSLDRLEPKEDYRLAETVRVRYSAIDLNGHVNNTEYVRWGMDALRSAFDPAGYVEGVQVSYLVEVFEGDMIDLYVGGNGGYFYLMGRRVADDSIVYLMEVASRGA
jgi:acyl-ACP thioesterase